MPTTIRDVAREAGTSVAAVSAALSDAPRHNIRVSAATRERIRAAAARLGFTPNPIAQSLVTRKTGMIGLVFPYSGAFVDHNPFCTQIMSGVFEEVVREKYNIMLHTAVGDDWNAAETNALIDPRVDGLILVLPTPESQAVSRCTQESFPCVAVVYDSPNKDICTVNADERGGGRLATEHLLQRGHRRIGHLAGVPNIASTEPRRQGYLDALDAAGITPDPVWVTDGGYTFEGGFAAMKRLLDLPRERRPSAVFAANDLCADGALKALREQGVRVPDEMALVGFDDTWFATMTQPALTSVHMPIAEMAIEATKMLIALVEKRSLPQTQIVLPVTITVRQSSGGAEAPSDQ